MPAHVMRFDKVLVLRAYASGFFPMGESANSPHIDWHNPAWRGVLPLDAFHIPKRLRRTVRAGRFEIRVDTDFAGVVDGCADPRRHGTWINPPIRKVYGELFADGHVHTVEAWRDGRLVGGLYGVALKSAFMGESMFSRETDASKVALVHLVALLKAGGFTLLDTQMVTPHMVQFGTVEVPRPLYLALLADALNRKAVWDPAGISGAVAALLESAAA
ncbi:MAG: leucyl/phenylalanyl-tRNA--protein transferase [Rhodospirillaceae bacterium]|nr:leucyl/phenylalanyl-tRNA--protein transferase [Rhodospirillaceae bacterium]